MLFFTEGAKWPLEDHLFPTTICRTGSTLPHGLSITSSTELPLGHHSFLSLRVIQGTPSSPRRGGRPENHCSGLPLDRKQTIGLEKERPRGEPCQGRGGADAPTAEQSEPLKLGSGMYRVGVQEGKGNLTKHTLKTLTCPSGVGLHPISFKGPFPHRVGSQVRKIMSPPSLNLQSNLGPHP